jgi:hypothetical protein
VVVVPLLEVPDDVEGRSAVLVEDGDDVVVRELDRPELQRDPDPPDDVDQRRGWHPCWVPPAARSTPGAPAVPGGGQSWRGGVRA